MRLTAWPAGASAAVVVLAAGGIAAARHSGAGPTRPDRTASQHSSASPTTPLTTPSTTRPRSADGLLHCGDPIGTPHPTDLPVFVPAGTTGTSDDPAFERALCRVERSLAGLRLPAGAVRVARAPAGLTDPAQYPQDGDLVDRARFWTVPGDWNSVLAWFRARPPHETGTGVVGSQTGGTEPGGSLLFGGLIVTVRPDGAHSAVRADGQEIWTPTPDPSDRIGTVTGVDVTVDHGGVGPGSHAPVVRRRLGRADAQRLADAIDALSPATSGERSCPADRGFSDTLVFTTDHGTLTALDHVGGCRSVEVTGGGRHRPVLDGDIDALVLTALGLPADYGDD